jgi:hypothetical protein
MYSKFGDDDGNNATPSCAQKIIANASNPLHNNKRKALPWAICQVMKVK